MVLAVILLTTVGLSAVWWLTLREQQIDARLDHLITEAEEIAYLAGSLSGDSLMDTMRDTENVTWSYINQVADRVTREYNAYVVIMDSGRGMIRYDSVGASEDPASVELMTNEKIYAALDRIVAGESIRMRTEN